MLEIRLVQKRADQLLRGDLWAWSGELLWVEDIYEDAGDDCYVHIRALSSWGSEGWTLLGADLVEVEL